MKIDHGDGDMVTSTLGATSVIGMLGSVREVSWTMVSAAERAHGGKQ